MTEISVEYPLLLKLEDRHASSGITTDSIVYNSQQLYLTSKRLINKYHAKILAEEYIPGCEYIATVWGNNTSASLLNCFTLIFKDPKVNMIDTENSKFITTSAEYKNLKIISTNDMKSLEKIGRVVVHSYRTLKFNDYGRFELRERDGVFYVIDCNPNPWLGLNSVLFKGTKKLGYNYGETIMKICEFALKRKMK
jgi:D-alanine-D-alanine ligase-like ATP-grasp enzyme